MNDEEALEFGLQLWVEDDGNGGRFFLDGGNNSLQMLVNWVWVKWEVIDIMDWMGRSTNTTQHNNQQFIWL